MYTFYNQQQQIATYIIILVREYWILFKNDKLPGATARTYVYLKLLAEINQC